MSNILLVNDNVQDYQKIINACNDNTYSITYNQLTDTYDTIFAKYENLVSENNIEVLNHLALVAHESNVPEFIFLEKENRMLISKYLEDPTPPPENEISIPTASTDEDILPLEDTGVISPSGDDDPENIPTDSSMIINNLDTWTTFKEFIKKFNIQKSLDFLGCAILQSPEWKYVLKTLETEQHLNLNIRGSDDSTGNLKVGANWVLESDNVNIKGLYFNSESIEKWNYKLSTYNFTNLNGGSTYIGPNSTAGYNGTSLEGQVTQVDGIQRWVVPTTMLYSIEAWGASGGDGRDYLSQRYGGVGRYVKITTTLEAGTVIYILVGQGGRRSYDRCAGGGGGTYVTTAKGNTAQNSDILVIAGGGGGGGHGPHDNSHDGQSPEINARGVGEDGGYSYDYHTAGNKNPGGTNGSGGKYASNGTRQTQGACGGGGFFGDGAGGYNNISLSSNVGKSFTNGGEGGQATIWGYGGARDYGGFGGGGSQPHANHVGGGGGGGYNGGAAGGNYNGAWSGGGGSSYSIVTPDIDIEWERNHTTIARNTVGRHGKVTISGAGPPPPPTGDTPQGPDTDISAFPIPAVITFMTLKNTYIKSNLTNASGHQSLREGGLYDFSTHTFTNCGQTGHTGPTLNQCKTTYGENTEPWNDINFFNVIGKSGVNGIQVWTVPDHGYYEVEVFGARGGGIPGVPSGTAGGGLGARMKSRFYFEMGDKYMILCGQQGATYQGSGNAGAGASGGGGTFFVKGDDYSTVTLDDLQLVAGGGGGRGNVTMTSHGGEGIGVMLHEESTAGGAASGQYGAGGGGGLISNGAGDGTVWEPSFTGGYSFKNGGEGGTGGESNSGDYGASGGFGGGGGASYHSGAGGGGVYGGDGAEKYYSDPSGLGGGSHNKGISIDQVSGDNDGDGKIIITATTESGTPRTINSANIKLSYFRGTTFETGDPVPDDPAPISINTHFKGRTFAPPGLYTFTSHTFTNCGADGMDGPTLSDCKNIYGNNEPWDNLSYFDVVGQSGGIQKWTVPISGPYTITAHGGEGGTGFHYNTTSPGAAGGKGAIITGTFNLTNGDILWIVVGQKGHTFGDGSGSGSTTYTHRPGAGGGGTYVVKASPENAVNSDILVIAGGGGGGRGRTSGIGQQPGGDGLTTETGTYTGSAGQGGVPNGGWYYGFTGAGFEGNGRPGLNIPDSSWASKYFDEFIPQSYKNGSRGGKVETWAIAQGGFGGGGGAGLVPGAGGGYSGGNTTGSWSTSGNAYGGGSFNSGTNKSATTGQAGDGHGKVVITFIG